MRSSPMATTKSLQRHWAREHGMPGKPSLEAILLAQIEHHRTEVFYNLDPVRYPEHVCSQACRAASGRHSAGGPHHREMPI